MIYKSGAVDLRVATLCCSIPANGGGDEEAMRPASGERPYGAASAEAVQAPAPDSTKQGLHAVVLMRSSAPPLRHPCIPEPPRTSGEPRASQSTASTRRQDSRGDLIGLLSPKKL